MSDDFIWGSVVCEISVLSAKEKKPQRARGGRREVQDNLALQPLGGFKVPGREDPPAVGPHSALVLHGLAGRS